jgi:hypothetical protein
MKRCISLVIAIFIAISSLYADGQATKQEQHVH